MEPSERTLFFFAVLLLAGCATGDHKSKTAVHSLTCVILCIKIDTEHATESQTAPASGTETESPSVTSQTQPRTSEPDKVSAPR